MCAVAECRLKSENTGMLSFSRAWDWVCDTVTASLPCCNIRSRAGARATVSLPPRLCTAHSSGAAKRTTCCSNCTLVFEAKYLAERRNYFKIFPLPRPGAGLSLSESRIAITVTLSTSAAALQRASQLGVILTAGLPRQHTQQAGAM